MPVMRELTEEEKVILSIEDEPNQGFVTKIDEYGFDPQHQKERKRSKKKSHVATAHFEWVKFTDGNHT